MLCKWWEQGPFVVEIDLLLDTTMDPKESATKDLPVDTTGCCDMQVASGMQNTTRINRGCFKKGLGSGRDFPWSVPKDRQRPLLKALRTKGEYFCKPE